MLLRTLFYLGCNLLPLKNNWDLHVISLYSITAQSNIKVMRIKKIIQQTKEAHDLQANFPCQYYRKCIRSSLENILFFRWCIPVVCTYGHFIPMVILYPWLFHNHSHFISMVVLYPQSFCTHISCFIPMHGRFISTVVLYPWLFCIQSFHTQIQSICTQFEPVCTQMAGSFLPVLIYIHSKYLTHKHMNTCWLLCMTN